MELSVIVPVYNGEKTLRCTLDSLLAQGKLPFSWEVVAVDDGSTDGSLTILKEYEKKGQEAGVEIRVLTFENGGVGVCRNRGLAAARGKVITYLDSDDQLVPGALSSLMEKKKETGASVLIFDSCYLFADGKTSSFSASPHPGGWMEVEDYMLSLPCPWNKLFDRRLFTDENFLFEEGILYEDLALIPALGIGAKGKIWYEKKPFHLYYQSEGSIMRSPWSERKLDIFPALEALKRNAEGEKEAVEYLFWLHLYRNFTWIFWHAGRRDAICRGNKLMRKHFPHWQKNPLIRRNASLRERLTSLLFYYEAFPLIALWKGGR
ncbi:MAG: glycosyltransferase family 2 protein [Clostridia bacterium]|nr:glycosyltransferase family 2 protein [Clostridia bacterium]